MFVLCLSLKLSWSQIGLIFEHDFTGEKDIYSYTLMVFACTECSFQMRVPKLPKPRMISLLNGLRCE